MFSYLFSFRGRINRAKMWRFWLFAIAWEALCFGVIWIIGSLAKLDDPIGDAAFSYDTPHNLVQWLGTITFYVFLIGYAWTLAAVSVKRLHDRAKSAIWLLLLWGATAVCVGGAVLEMEHQFVPPAFHETAVGALVTVGNVFLWWWFIELFFLPGTPGDNQFGSDPLAKSAPLTNA